MRLNDAYTAVHLAAGTKRGKHKIARLLNDLAQLY